MSNGPQIVDAAYEEGKKLFRKKRTLRSIVEPMIALEQEDFRREGEPLPQTYERRDAERNAGFSRLLGFADAFVDAVRR